MSNFLWRKTLAFIRFQKVGCYWEEGWIFDPKNVKNHKLVGSIFVCICLFAFMLHKSSLHGVCALCRCWWVFWNTAASQVWRRSCWFFRSSVGILRCLSGSRHYSLSLNFLWWGARHMHVYVHLMHGVLH